MNGNHVMLLGIAACILTILLYYPARFAWYRVSTAYMRVKGDYYEEATFRLARQNAELLKKCADQDALLIGELSAQIELLEDKISLLERENDLLRLAQK